MRYWLSILWRKLRFARRATSAAELNAPVGYDKHSYGYRSGGDKVNQGRREPYGTAFREGDVVGLYMYAGPRLATDDKVWHSGSSVSLKPPDTATSPPDCSV